MAAKRNSRTYKDDATHDGEGYQKQEPSDYTHWHPTDEEASAGSLPKDSALASPLQSNTTLEKESAASANVERWPVAALAGPPVASSPQFLFPTTPGENRPDNFGVVIPGVYRSSYPKPESYGFLQGLKLKTVVTLVKRDDIDHELETFLATNGICQVVFNMKGTKKQAIPYSTMSSILDLVLDPRNYPMLVHCNHGKHRTGCVVAAVRKASGWNLDMILDEYRAHATPKVRECDIEYISSFRMTPLQPATLGASGQDCRCKSTPMRSFFRTLLFSTLVVTIWIISGTQMMMPESSGQ